MKKKTGTNVKWLKGEKFMYLLILLLLVLVPVMNVFNASLLSKTNIKVEELEYKINNQLETNESLSMQINELTSLQSIQEIAEAYGLSYENGNIKNLD